jgi:hypothetical protein
MKTKLIAGAAAGLAVAAAGGALAATQLDTPKAESQAVVNDAAQQLGITPSKLSDALKKALENRVDAQVTAGQLTKAQGDAIKARIEAGDVPLFAGPGFGHGRGGPGGGAVLEPAATYLGLTPAELRTKLNAGKTLADLAKDEGKTVDGLIQALVDDAKTHLHAAVTAGRLTQAQADQVLSDVKARITDVVNGNAPRFDTGPAFDRRPAFNGAGALGPYA